MDHYCRKDNRISEFSGVLSATLPPPTPAEVLPGHFHHTATPTPEPRRLPATDQPSRRAPQPLSKRSHPRRISASQTPAGPCPHTPGNHLCGTEFGPSPAGGPTLHHRPFPRLVSFPGPWPAPALRGQCSCTAAEYSNGADQHRPTTSAIGRRPAEMTTIDCPARSSGRRGRGFKSCNPTAGTTSVAVPSPASDVADVACVRALRRRGTPSAPSPTSFQ